MRIRHIAFGRCARRCRTWPQRLRDRPRHQGHAVPGRLDPRRARPSTSFPREGAAGAAILSLCLDAVAAARGARAISPPARRKLADMLVRLDYGVDEGQTEYRCDPFYGPRLRLGPWRLWLARSVLRPVLRSARRLSTAGPIVRATAAIPYYYGWDDPFCTAAMAVTADTALRRMYDSYTVYKSHLDMDIVQRSSNAPLFEGHAQARSQTDELDALVPNLIEAMFTGFPGRNGETVKITVPAKPRG